MNIVQTTRSYTKAELEKGIDIDFVSHAKKLKGIMLINPDGNAPVYENATIGVKVDRGIYIEDSTLTAMLQSSNNVPPNQRFFTLAGKINTPSRKCNVKIMQPSTTAEFIIAFLLEY